MQENILVQTERMKSGLPVSLKLSKWESKQRKLIMKLWSFLENEQAMTNSCESFLVYPGSHPTGAWRAARAPQTWGGGWWVGKALLEKDREEKSSAMAWWVWVLVRADSAGCLLRCLLHLAPLCSSGSDGRGTMDEAEMLAAWMPPTTWVYRAPGLLKPCF